MKHEPFPRADDVSVGTLQGHWARVAAEDAEDPRGELGHPRDDGESAGCNRHAQSSEITRNLDFDSF